MKIRQIFYRYTDKVEPLSLDEAFLDVTDCHLFKGSATYIAEDIRRAIFEELHLTASAGVAPRDPPGLGDAGDRIFDTPQPG